VTLSTICVPWENTSKDSTS